MGSLQVWGADRIENSVSTGPPRSQADVLALGYGAQMLPFFFFISHILCEYQREIKMKSAERMQDASCVYLHSG